MYTYRHRLSPFFSILSLRDYKQKLKKTEFAENMFTDFSQHNLNWTPSLQPI